MTHIKPRRWRMATTPARSDRIEAGQWAGPHGGDAPRTVRRRRPCSMPTASQVLATALVIVVAISVATMIRLY